MECLMLKIYSYSNINYYWLLHEMLTASLSVTFRFISWSAHRRLIWTWRRLNYRVEFAMKICQFEYLYTNWKWQNCTFNIFYKLFEFLYFEEKNFAFHEWINISIIFNTGQHLSKYVSLSRFAFAQSHNFWGMLRIFFSLSIETIFRVSFPGFKRSFCES